MIIWSFPGRLSCRNTSPCIRASQQHPIAHTSKEESCINKFLMFVLSGSERLTIPLRAEHCFVGESGLQQLWGLEEEKKQSNVALTPIGGQCALQILPQIACLDDHFDCSDAQADGFPSLHACCALLCWRCSRTQGGSGIEGPEAAHEQRDEDVGLHIIPQSTLVHIHTRTQNTTLSVRIWELQEM